MRRQVGNIGCPNQGWKSWKEPKTMLCALPVTTGQTRTAPVEALRAESGDESYSTSRRLCVIAR